MQYRTICSVEIAGTYAGGKQHLFRCGMLSSHQIALVKRMDSEFIMKRHTSNKILNKIIFQPSWNCHSTGWREQVIDVPNSIPHPDPQIYA